MQLLIAKDAGRWPVLEHTRGKLTARCMPLQVVPIHFGFGCDCGVIRRKYGELSRHPCIQTDTIWPVAYQKFPQKKGHMAANFEVYCPTDDGYVEALARDGFTSSRPMSNNNNNADHHCTRPASPSVGEKDSPRSEPRDCGHPGQRHEAPVWFRRLPSSWWVP